jgi:arginine exporter protein ArgO
VTRPPRIARTRTTLKLVALAKLSDIALTSAAFEGADILSTRGSRFSSTTVVARS